MSGTGPGERGQWCMVSGVGSEVQVHGRVSGTELAVQGQWGMVSGAGLGVQGP